jgi:hypothetical protein
MRRILTTELARDKALTAALEQPYINTLTYFLQPVELDGPVKIGTTTALIERMKAYLTHSPVPLYLVGLVADDIETEVQSLFWPDRLHGEWFRHSPELQAVLERFALTDDGHIATADESHRGLTVQRKNTKAAHSARLACAKRYNISPDGYLIT